MVEAGRDRGAAAGRAERARDRPGVPDPDRDPGGIPGAVPVAHVVQQANGNPQALADLLADSAKERVVDKQRIRALRHAAGVRYLDFTPVMIVALASVVGARYLAIGTGDTELYVFAGMLAAVVLSVRVFLVRGAGKAN